jgi:hypothetical protein
VTVSHLAGADRRDQNGDGTPGGSPSAGRSHDRSALAASPTGRPVSVPWAETASTIRAPTAESPPARDLSDRDTTEHLPHRRSVMLHQRLLIHNTATTPATPNRAAKSNKLPVSRHRCPDDIRQGRPETAY